MREFMSNVTLAKNEIDLRISFVKVSALRGIDGCALARATVRPTVKDVRNRNLYTSPAHWKGFVTSSMLFHASLKFSSQACSRK